MQSVDPRSAREHQPAVPDREHALDVGVGALRIDRHRDAAGGDDRPKSFDPCEAVGGHQADGAATGHTARRDVLGDPLSGVEDPPNESVVT